MSNTKSHKDLVVWQKSIDFVEAVYKLSKCFPSSELYALTSQLNKAAISVPANIAEGNGRGAIKDYARFVAIAKGSLLEAETYILLSIRLGYVDKEKAEPVLNMASEISKMLTALRSKLSEMGSDWS
jgi:four helix bundle protein